MRRIWLECRGRIAEQTPIQPTPHILNTPLTPSTLQNNIALDNWVQLAKDLQYTGISNDPTILKDFVYEELKKRLGGKTAHVRKNPFEESVKKTYASKSSSKKSSKSTRYCSNCEKEGHSKNKCTKGTKGKKSKKVNHAHRSETEDSSSSSEEEDSSEESDSSESSDDEPHHSYNSEKKKW